MRKKIVAGNWKMNLSHVEAISLAIEVSAEVQERPTGGVQLIMCPPYPFIKSVADATSENLSISIGAQNCATEKEGAYTGEVSAAMLSGIGAKYIIIGHSERRYMYFETDEILVRKISQVLSNNLIPIFCCGETLAERESGKHFDIIKSQISNALFHLGEIAFSRVIIAYEPVWAIGTGITATSAQVQEMHHFIRKTLNVKFGETAAQGCSILYGGSCNATNAAELFANSDVDGGLIGGSSLKAKDFVTIANSF